MKKILYILVVFLYSSFAFAIKAPDEGAFMRSLRLNKTQKIKIEQIKNNSAQKRELLYEKRKSPMSNEENKKFQSELYEIHKQEQKEILNVLNFAQKQRYIEFTSRRY